MKASHSRMFLSILGMMLLIVIGGPTACSQRPTEIPSVPPNGLSVEWRRSLETATEEVRSHPRSAEAWGKLGQKYHAVELNGQALACYRNAQRLDPKAQRWWHLAGALNLLEEPERALSDLRNAVQSATNSELREVSRLLLGRSLSEIGKDAEAVAELKSLVRDNPHHAGARLVLARIAQSEARVPDAETWLQPCLTNAYTARPALLLLSQVRLSQGKPEEAQRLSRQGLAAPRNSEWPDPFLREILRHKEGSAADEDRANSLLSQGRLGEAESLIVQLTTQSPHDPNPHLLLGRLRLQQRRCDEAERAFRRHLDLLPDSFNGEVQLGSALLCQQKWPEAVQTLQRAAALKPDSAQAHHNLGVALLRSGNAIHAAKSFREALRYNPLDAGTSALLAEALIKLDQREEARQQVQRALQLNPKQPRALELQKNLQP